MLEAGPRRGGPATTVSFRCGAGFGTKIRAETHYPIIAILINVHVQECVQTLYKGRQVVLLKPPASRKQSHGQEFE